MRQDEGTEGLACVDNRELERVRTRSRSERRERHVVEIASLCYRGVTVGMGHVD